MSDKEETIKRVGDVNLFVARRDPMIAGQHDSSVYSNPYGLNSPKQDNGLGNHHLVQGLL